MALFPMNIGGGGNSGVDFDIVYMEKVGTTSTRTKVTLGYKPKIVLALSFSASDPSTSLAYYMSSYYNEDVSTTQQTIGSSNGISVSNFDYAYTISSIDNDGFTFRNHNSIYLLYFAVKG